MPKYRVIRAVSYVFEVEAENSTEAEEIVCNGDAICKETYPTDDIYVEELE